MDRARIVKAVRQPASAAIAGIIFSGILGTVIVLFHNAAPAIIADSGRWIDDPSSRNAVDLGLNLIPFAGIAFLWFIAVTRALLGSREDRFFETVFLGSGLLFVAMIFAAAAVLKAALALTDAGVALPSETLAFAWMLSNSLMATFGTRMAAVFTLSVATTGIRMGTIPRWLAVAGYLTGLLLLLTPPIPNVTQFLFPLWVLGVSLHILIRRRSQVPTAN